ncbi:MULTISPECIES: hypothetical protein [Comamonas]|uniref:hypothetical protein n=1 Tax=Comamonas TaxID=283 RepID=UPI000623BDA9|nr:MULTISPECIES: hypothetical protein [Comamonas]MDH1252132.1 hypothetical protein [Comamonas thiooxydans]TYK75521.1 hypothetical protein FSY45_13885 [Comamonas sp. Z1]
MFQIVTDTKKTRDCDAQAMAISNMTSSYRQSLRLINPAGFMSCQRLDLAMMLGLTIQDMESASPVDSLSEGAIHATSF